MDRPVRFRQGPATAHLPRSSALSRQRGSYIFLQKRSYPKAQRSWKEHGKGGKGERGCEGRANKTRTKIGLRRERGRAFPICSVASFYHTPDAALTDLSQDLLLERGAAAVMVAAAATADAGRVRARTFLVLGGTRPEYGHLSVLALLFQAGKPRKSRQDRLRFQALVQCTVFCPGRSLEESLHSSRHAIATSTLVVFLFPWPACSISCGAGSPLGASSESTTAAATTRIRDQIYRADRGVRRERV